MFTSSDFQTDSNSVKIAISQPASMTKIMEGLSPQVFRTELIPGKGKGFVARVNIAKGSCIVREKPLFTTPNLEPLDVMEQNIAKQLKALSKAEQRQFFSLHNNFPGKHPFSGIVKTNALPCGPNSVIGGLYREICRINHSCLPNSHNSWNSETCSETIYAIRDIRSGEEITISYDKGGPSDIRRAHLKDAFGFDCGCELCSLPPPALRSSDARRVRIQDLDRAIGQPERVTNTPNDCLADCRLLLRILEEEYGSAAGVLIARLYYDAFQICVAHSDQARASVFAERSYQSRLICEGEHNPETRKMRELMKDPTSHRIFGHYKRWNLAKKLVPKSLDAQELEKWLWRESR